MEQCHSLFRKKYACMYFVGSPFICLFDISQNIEILVQFRIKFLYSQTENSTHKLALLPSGAEKKTGSSKIKNQMKPTRVYKFAHMLIQLNIHVFHFVFLLLLQFYQIYGPFNNVG